MNTSSKQPLLNIPTTLIMGFLGVGKTSAVLHLMAQKPINERWAVLVNEFGKIGIDGAVYRSQGIDVKEIPGGCMCCAAGVPLQVAVNRILSQSRPHRLLIETSGLGHPKRVLDTLNGKHFRASLDLKASICLVDPRNLADSRYTTNETFIDQIALADILVANKFDLCDRQDMQAFGTYARALKPPKQKLVETSFANLDVSLLALSPTTNRSAEYPLLHETPLKTNSAPLTETLEATTRPRDGFYSLGWSFSQEAVFDFDQLVALLQSLNALRIKALMQTNHGWQLFNYEGVNRHVSECNQADDSRLELIFPEERGDSGAAPYKLRTEKDRLEKQIKNCLV